MKLYVIFAIRAKVSLRPSTTSQTHPLSRHKNSYKEPSLQAIEVISANMTLEEKFEALMKNYEQMRVQHEEMRA